MAIARLRAAANGGTNYVKQLSEVDLSDPENVKVTANDPGGTMVVHLGKEDFLPRYKLYVSAYCGMAAAVPERAVRGPAV